jgi:hypothetical protein
MEMFMLSILIHLHFHHTKLCGIMPLACMYILFIFFFLEKNIRFSFSIRGKSTHPGVVVDLCQNPDDPTRVRI